MGLAARNAAAMQAAACQLLVLRDADDQGLTGELGRVWKDSGRHQETIFLPGKPRTANEGATGASQLVAAVEIDFGNDDVILALVGMAALAQQLRGLEPALLPPRWHGRSLSLAYRNPLTAFHAMQRLLAMVTDVTAIRVAAHYTVAHLASDPFGGTDILLGTEMALPGRMLAAVPSGAIYASGHFANALAARTPAVRAELMGELAGAESAEPVELFSLHAEL